MSEHLKLARLKIEAACKMKPTDEHAVKLEEMLYCLLLHLEAQQETPASASQPTEQPAPPLSSVFMKERGIQPTWGASSGWSYRVSPDGLLTLKVPLVILASHNSVWIPGLKLEEEIGVTLTSKASTPPAGSASPSTAEPTPEASGVAGRSIPCPDGIEGCAVLHLSPASSPEPAQGGREHHRIKWPDGGFWVAADHSLPAPPDNRFIHAYCETCETGVLVTLTNHEGRE